MKGEFIYANGLNISQARKIFKYIFRDFFIQAEKNEANMRFDIFVKTKIITENDVLSLFDFFDPKDFNEFWNIDVNTLQIKKNPPFNVLYIDPTNQ